MDVSKDLFLSTLKQKINEYETLKSYERVVEGICNHCNKGCKAYKFKAENLPSLSLYFEEKDGKVIDIYLCNALKEDKPDEHDWDIYFNFYEEEKKKAAKAEKEKKKAEGKKILEYTNPFKSFNFDLISYRERIEKTTVGREKGGKRSCSGSKRWLTINRMSSSVESGRSICR